MRSIATLRIALLFATAACDAPRPPVPRVEAPPPVPPSNGSPRVLGEFTGRVERGTLTLDAPAELSRTGKGARASVKLLNLIVQGGSHPADSVHLRNGSNGIGAASGIPGCAVDQYCATVIVDSYLTSDTLSNVHLELTSLTPTGYEGANSVASPPAHTSSRYGLWSYGAIAPAGTSSVDWVFSLPSEQDFTFQGRMVGNVTCGASRLDCDEDPGTLCECTSGRCGYLSCLGLCWNGAKDQDETAPDCGGATCAARCTTGQACTSGTDCYSGDCTASACGAPTFHVDSSAAPGGNGSALTPFTDLAAAQAVAGPGATLAVANGNGLPYAALALENGQTLIGEGATRPTLTGVTLADRNTLSFVAIGDGGITGASQTGVSLVDVTLASAAAGISLSSFAGRLALEDVNAHLTAGTSAVLDVSTSPNATLSLDGTTLGHDASGGAGLAAFQLGAITTTGTASAITTLNGAALDVEQVRFEGASFGTVNAVSSLRGISITDARGTLTISAGTLISGPGTAFEAIRASSIILGPLVIRGGGGDGSYTSTVFHLEDVESLTMDAGGLITDSASLVLVEANHTDSAVTLPPMLGNRHLFDINYHTDVVFRSSGEYGFDVTMASGIFHPGTRQVLESVSTYGEPSGQNHVTASLLSNSRGFEVATRGTATTTLDVLYTMRPAAYDRPIIDVVAEGSSRANIYLTEAYFDNGFGVGIIRGRALDDARLDVRADFLSCDSATNLVLSTEGSGAPQLNVGLWNASLHGHYIPGGLAVDGAATGGSVCVYAVDNVVTHTMPGAPFSFTRSGGTMDVFTGGTGALDLASFTSGTNNFSPNSPLVEITGTVNQTTSHCGF